MLSLKKLDYLTTKQLQQIHNLKSIGNAQRILRDMCPYLHSFHDGQNIYYLNKTGREYVNCDVIRKRTTTVAHYIMRNDLYIHSDRPADWKNEIRIISGEGNKKITIVADVHFMEGKKHHIVEIDHMQDMNKNKAKIDKYRRLIERNAFKGMPRLIWVTTTDYRRERLLELCDGLDVKVFLNTDFK